MAASPHTTWKAVSLEKLVGKQLMGQGNSHEDSYVSRMLDDFSDPNAISPASEFWDLFFCIKFRQYLRKSKHGASFLDAHELKLRMNCNQSQNLRTFIRLIWRKIDANATPCSLAHAANGLYLLRYFLYRLLTAPSISEARLSALCVQDPWHQYLRDNGYDRLLQSLVYGLIVYKVDTKEMYSFQSESASFILSAFLVPLWQAGFHEPPFAYSCLLALPAETAADMVHVLMNYFIRENISHPSDGIAIDDISDITWVEFIGAYDGCDKLGDTCLWLLLLLSHRPANDGDNDVYYTALCSFVNDSTSTISEPEESAYTIDGKAKTTGLYKNELLKSNLDSDTVRVVESQGCSSSKSDSIDVQKNHKDEKTEVGTNEITSDDENENAFGSMRRYGSLPARLNLESLKEDKANSRSLLASGTTQSLPCDCKKIIAPLPLKINYSDLFTAICCSIDKDGTLMLVYTLILRNKDVKKYFLAREEIDLLVTAVTKKLYFAENDTNPFSIYSSLCIILMLTEDSEFCNRLHGFPVMDVTWFRERILSGVSLGSLLVIVLCRLLNTNVSLLTVGGSKRRATISKQCRAALKDDFIHDNVLAVMSNMAPTLKNLHPFACQQLVTAFEVLGRRFLRMRSCDGLNRDSEIPEEIQSQDEKINDADCLKHIMLRLLLIMDACIVVHLPQNPNLVYSLLHKAPMFRRFMEIEDFKCSLTNMALVWNFYNNRLLKRKGPLSEGDIFYEIKQCVDPFPHHLFRPVEDIKYQYIEDKNCPGYFLPFVCNIISEETKLGFSSDMLNFYNCVYFSD